MTTDNGSPHWSKDFVEHIRTVHFALMTVCGGLILLIGSSQTYRPADAISQLGKIIDARKQTLDSILSANAVTALTGQIKAGAKIRGQNSFECRVDRLWIGVSHAGENSSWYSEYQQPIPDNIEGIRKWWETHQPERTFVVAAHDYPFRSKTSPLIGRIIDHREAKPSQSVVEFAPSSNTFLEEADSDILLDLRQGDKKDGSSWELAGSQAPYEIIIPVQIENRTLKGSNFIDPGHACETFDQCFPDLSRAAVAFQSLPLDSLKQHLLEQLDKGEEVFEAFGLKVKGPQLTFWGVVVVLAVQIYLFLHFRELRTKIEPGDSGWDVPWIGVYKSRFSRLVFFSTIFLMPLLAVGMLVFRTIWTLPLSGEWLGISLNGIHTIQTVGYAIAFLVCALLAIRTWQCRPILSEVSAAIPPAPKNNGVEAQKAVKNEEGVVSREAQPSLARSGQEEIPQTGNK
jgi:hypothetical protein